MWANNVLLRVHLYYWKWSFTQSGVFHCVKKHFGRVLRQMCYWHFRRSTECRILGYISLGDKEILEYAEVEQLKREVKDKL